MPPLDRKFWVIRAAKDNPKVGEVLLYGPIGYTTWWGDEVTPKQFKADLDALGDVDEIVVRIDSGGGDMFASHAIYSMLRSHPAKVTTYVDGLAASGASLVAMAGETVTMPQNAMMMIHGPRMFLYGTSADLRKAADELDQMRESMVPVYEAKCGKTREEIIAIMDAETWYTAAEAKEAGFCDVVEDLKQVAASLDGNVLTMNGRQVDLTAYHAFPRDKVPAAQKAPEPAIQPAVVAVAQPAAAAAPDAQQPSGTGQADEVERQRRLRLLRARARLAPQ
jgi:ATP-dependent Clp protease protease subunit